MHFSATQTVGKRRLSAPPREIDRGEIAALVEVANELFADIGGALEGTQHSLDNKMQTLREQLPSHVNVLRRVRGDPERVHFLP